MPTRPASSSSSSRATSKLVGVFRLLAAQHADAAAMFAEIRADRKTAAQRWPTLRRLLVSHEKGEVREVFPVLRAKPPTQPHADHHDDEARELEQMIGQLDATAFGSDAWHALFDRLAETVSQHAAEEEQAIFPDAQDALGEAKVVELEAPYTKAQQQVAEAL